MSYVFLTYPKVSMWHMVFWRAAVSLFITIIVMGKRVKRELYDQVTYDDFRRILVINVIPVGVGIPLTMLALKYFPASIVNAAANLQPIYTLFVAICLLGEVASAHDLASIAVTLVAIFLIMDSQVRSDLEGLQTGESPLAYKTALFGLMIFPLLAAIAQVVVKQIKSVTAVALTACSNITLMAVSSVAILWTKPAVGFNSNLAFGIFGLISLSAVFQVAMKVAFYIASRNLTVNRLSVFMQMSLLL
jgi:drug/metabolite transporter (DMT)-like permease